MLESFKEWFMKSVYLLLSAFNSEVKSSNFPYPETNISMHTGETEKFLESIDKWTPVHQ